MAFYSPQRKPILKLHSTEDRMVDDLNANDAGNNTPATPKGYHTLTPWIIVNVAARLIGFLEKALGAKETPGTRFHNIDGTIGHVEVRIGDSVVMLFDSRPDWPPTP